MSDGFFAPRELRVGQAAPVGDVVADDDEVGREQGVVFRGGGVIELEAVGAVVHADIVNKRLV